MSSASSLFLAQFLQQNISSLPDELFNYKDNHNHNQDANKVLSEMSSPSSNASDSDNYDEYSSNRDVEIVNYDLMNSDFMNNENDDYNNTIFDTMDNTFSGSVSNMSTSLLSIPHHPSLHPHLSQIVQSFLNSNNNNNSDTMNGNFDMEHIMNSGNNDVNNDDTRDMTDLVNVNWFMLILSILVIVGVLGNSLVCLAICYERRLQNATNYFLLSLAIADLLVSIIVMPISILYEFYGFWPFGYKTCNFWVTFDVLCCSSSIYHMVFISVGRYIGIKNPLHARQTLMVSRRAVMYKIALAWLLSALISCPITILAIIDKVNIQIDSKSCYISNNYFLFFGSFAAFYLPMIVMINCFILTVRLLNQKAKFCRSSNTSTSAPQTSGSRHGNEAVAINIEHSGDDVTMEREPSDDQVPNKGSEQNSSRKSSVSVKKSSQNGGKRKGSKSKTSKVSKSGHDHDGHHLHNTEPLMTRTFGSSLQVRTEQKASKVLGLVFFVFAVCWTPFFTLNLALALFPNISVPPYLSTTFLWLGYSSSTMNPIIYTIFNRNFRRAFMKVLKCGYHCNNGHGSAGIHGNNGHGTHGTHPHIGTVASDGGGGLTAVGVGVGGNLRGLSTNV